MHRFSLSDNWFPRSFFSIQVGENGAGKTTLLKLLMGTLDPIKGIRHAHRNLKIGYFTQHHVDQLDMSQSSVELLAARFPGKLFRQGRDPGKPFRQGREPGKPFSEGGEPGYPFRPLKEPRMPFRQGMEPCEWFR